jgi:cytochrome c biogenesis protein CcmG, thiol:disulfide interchange protein DsbE
MSVIAPAPVDEGSAEAPRRRSRVRWTAMAVGLALAALIGALTVRSGDAGGSPLIGKPAPLKAGTTVDGAPFVPSDLRGRWVVVNFFSTWCVPCQQEHPELVVFSERHGATRDAAVVSLVFEDETPKVRRFFADRGGDWPVVQDEDGRTALDFGVTGVPESYLVDPDGIVVERVVGGVDAGELDKLIRIQKQQRS